MLSIGEFALHGQVSVRMLRHYDATGLLIPARVDPSSGYRWYAAEQLSRLNRLIALKDLGFTLEQIGPVLDSAICAEQLRAMLLLRRAQVEESMAADQARLQAIGRRLRMIEKENLMSDLTFTEKALPTVTVSRLRAVAADQSEIAGLIGPMFGHLIPASAALGYDPDAPTIAAYHETGDGMELSACIPQTGDLPLLPGTEHVELPGAERAITVVHHGDMETIGDTWQALMQYVGAQGHSPAGDCREVYLATPMDDQDNWITELQQPIA